MISYYADEDIPVFLLAVYSKGSRADLSQAERNELRKLLTSLPQVWRAQARKRIVRSK